jgi:hypothetical protein
MYQKRRNERFDGIDIDQRHYHSDQQHRADVRAKARIAETAEQALKTYDPYAPEKLVSLLRGL